MRARLVASVLVATSLLAAGCDESAIVPSTISTSTVGALTGPGVEIVEVPAGDEPLEQIATRELERAQTDGRVVLIYVGAEWCEPCKRFHDAAKRGELDQAFPNLRLLELDHDRDGERLRAAGCVSELIPLFARPTPEGRCDARQRVAGGIKGSGAVPFLTKRLQEMLADG